MEIINSLPQDRTATIHDVKAVNMFPDLIAEIKRLRSENTRLGEAFFDVKFSHLYDWHDDGPEDETIREFEARLRTEARAALDRIKEEAFRGTK